LSPSVSNVASPPGMVAIPAGDWMWTDSVRSFGRLAVTLPTGSVMEYGCDSGSAARNRNTLTDSFLRNPNLAWILYIDSDMTPPAETAHRLLSHHVDIVGALCFMRRPPYQAALGELIGERIPGQSRGIHEVAFVGTGCMLVSRRTIEAIPAPWFEHPAPGVGEDEVFSAKVRALGTPVYVDCGMEVGHMSSRPIGRDEAYFLQKQAGHRQSDGSCP
jgi:hypothetical protein